MYMSKTLCYDILCFLLVASPRPSILQTTSKLADLSNLVTPKAADKWGNICVQLMGDENQNIRNTIRKDFQKSEECCDEMFSQWL